MTKSTVFALVVAAAMILGAAALRPEPAPQVVVHDGPMCLATDGPMCYDTSR